MLQSVAEIRHPEVRAFAERAIAFLECFRWCEEVRECAAKFAIAGVLGVFRAEITSHSGADPVVWVVIGDLPPAYLAYVEGDIWQDALDGYVGEMQAWVDAVQAEESVEQLIPVNVTPTLEHAHLLASRLAFIRTHFLNVDPTSIESDV